jgi:hypothetical protein
MNPCSLQQGFIFTERMMKRDIEKFVAVVSHCSERDKVLETIQTLRTTKDYKCPTVSVFALHLIFDLYSEGSSRQANVNRITTNLEAAADELSHFSKLIKALR